MYDSEYGQVPRDPRIRDFELPDGNIIQVHKRQLAKLLRRDMITDVDGNVHALPPAQALQDYIEADNAKRKAEHPDSIVFTIVSDPNHWRPYGIFTPEQWEDSMDYGSFSDVYKSVHGFRPRHINWGELTKEQKQSCWDMLKKESDEQEEDS